MASVVSKTNRRTEGRDGMGMKPILFNTQMVNAILGGRKTQTRRPIKGLPLYEPFFEEDEGRGWLEDKGSGTFYALEVYSKIQPGDVLWVRETWDRYVDGNTGETIYIFKAHCKNRKILEEVGGFQVKWRPSIHMPKEAARLFLRVTGVRCERLQSMSPEDCANDGGFEPEAIKAVGIAPLFGTLWDSTVKKDDLKHYGWKANPWVWVITFERVERDCAWE